MKSPRYFKQSSRYIFSNIELFFSHKKFTCRGRIQRDPERPVHPPLSLSLLVGWHHQPLLRVAVQKKKKKKKKVDKLSRGSLKAWAGRSTHSSRPLLSVSSLPLHHQHPIHCFSSCPFLRDPFISTSVFPGLFLLHFRFSLSTELGSATTLMHLERTPPRAEEGRCVRVYRAGGDVEKRDYEALFPGVVSNRGTRI